MKTIINNTAQKEFIKLYRISDGKVYGIIGSKNDDFFVAALIKNIGNNTKIKQLEFKKNVIFTLEGKEIIEPAILRFKNINKKGILYSYEYEFAGHKFTKNYVKDEYETKEVTVQALQHTDLYKVVKEKISLNPSLEEIWKNHTNSKISEDFYLLTNSFDEYLYKFIINEKHNEPKALLAGMFVNSLKFDKYKTINYKLNFDKNTFELLNAKTR